MVRQIAPHDDAQAFDVEVRVLDLERIEGPLDQFDATAERIAALLQLERAPDVPVAALRQHAQHMAVEERRAVRLEAGEGQAEGHHARAIERAENLATDLGRDDEDLQRDRLFRGVAPYLVLQPDGRLQIRVRRERADRNPGHGFRFACSHNASISSSVAPATVRPCSFSLRST